MFGEKEEKLYKTSFIETTIRSQNMSDISKAYILVLIIFFLISILIIIFHECKKDKKYMVISNQYEDIVMLEMQIPEPGSSFRLDVGNNDLIKIEIKGEKAE